ncbi:maleylacetate reductase [Streptomyces sp. NPDC091292]|uniref:maleylacetate reductase n=1 Tax=Streptomyces sp. NPDC091292 TaxID=3365991 RepID=UPI003806CE59
MDPEDMDPAEGAGAPFAFTYRPAPARVTFGPGALRALPSLADELGLSRVLVLSTPGRARLAATVAARLGARCAGTWAGARTHVPVTVAAEARAEAAARGADACVAVGGGSATGLAKALALDPGLPYIAVPTSYAGSEMTPTWGLTEQGRKTTGKDPAVLASAIVYDPELTYSLPTVDSVTSAMNAIAHAAEALYAPDTSPFVALLAEEGVRRIATALPAIAENPSAPAARADALYGAWLCGACLGATTMSLHHKLCHVLGGALDLPHAATHTVVLPYALAFNAPAAQAQLLPLTRALSTHDAPAALQTLSRTLGAPRSLEELGMKKSDISRIAELTVAHPYANPRPLSFSDAESLLRRAYSGADA